MKKPLLVTAGLLSLTAGIIGIVVPLLPTTPFLLLAAACFMRGSDRLYTWLMSRRLLGAYIRNYRQHRAIPLVAKLWTLILLWSVMLVSIILFAEPLWLKLLLLVIAVGVTIHIFMMKTLVLKEKDDE